MENLEEGMSNLLDTIDTQIKLYNYSKNYLLRKLNNHNIELTSLEKNSINYYQSMVEHLMKERKKLMKKLHLEE